MLLLKKFFNKLKKSKGNTKSHMRDALSVENEIEYNFNNNNKYSSFFFLRQQLLKKDCLILIITQKQIIKVIIGKNH